MKLTTRQLADALSLREQSIRARVCRTGSYFGLVPQVFPNGRLAWPADAVEQLLATKPKKGGE